MSAMDLSQKTVIELRKLAKEHGVTLGAGVSKADIIAKLEAAGVGAEPEAAPAEQPREDAPVVAQVIPASSQPQFRAAWHNPTPRYSAKPAYQAPRYEQRPASGRYTPGSADPQHPTPVRPAGYTPRFGPGAPEPPADTAPPA